MRDWACSRVSAGRLDSCAVLEFKVQGFGAPGQLIHASKFAVSNISMHPAGSQTALMVAHTISARGTSKRSGNKIVTMKPYILTHGSFHFLFHYPYITLPGANSHTGAWFVGSTFSVACADAMEVARGI